MSDKLLTDAQETALWRAEWEQISETAQTLHVQNQRLCQAFNDIATDELRPEYEHSSYEDSYWRVVNIARSILAGAIQDLSKSTGYHD